MRKTLPTYPIALTTRRRYVGRKKSIDKDRILDAVEASRPGHDGGGSDLKHQQGKSRVGLCPTNLDRRGFRRTAEHADLADGPLSGVNGRVIDDCYGAPSGRSGFAPNPDTYVANPCPRK